ncbi:MAG: hypothetical protein H6Q75_4 [Firmicutes bacterium]|nr:hypothetical protein [Bacillota bacterium]
MATLNYEPVTLTGASATDTSVAVVFSASTTISKTTYLSMFYDAASQTSSGVSTYFTQSFTSLPLGSTTSESLAVILGTSVSYDSTFLTVGVGFAG